MGSPEKFQVILRVARSKQNLHPLLPSGALETLVRCSEGLPMWKQGSAQPPDLVAHLSVQAFPGQAKEIKAASENFNKIICNSNFKTELIFSNFLIFTITKICIPQIRSLLLMGEWLSSSKSDKISKNKNHLIQSTTLEFSVVVFNIRALLRCNSHAI